MKILNLLIIIMFLFLSACDKEECVRGKYSENDIKAAKYEGELDPKVKGTTSQDGQAPTEIPFITGFINRHWPDKEWQASVKRYHEKTDPKKK